MHEDQLRSDEQDLLWAWQEYGKGFSTFVPEEQPFPSIWDPAIPEPDENSRVHRDSRKHWERLFPTRGVLRQRCAKHHILEGPSLDFDCLVPKFQKPLDIPPDERKQFPRKGDPPEWYEKALRMRS